ncbi:hypothetical protein SprV_0401575600 [Sparganum proliferum]
MAALVGLKTSACLLVLGVWGFIMLVLMGVFTRVNAVAFAEDIPINMTEWEALGFPSAYIDENWPVRGCFGIWRYPAAYEHPLSLHRTLICLDRGPFQRIILDSL